MSILLAWLMKVASHPLVARLLVPALTEGVARFLDGQAKRVELKAAVRVAKAGKTADDLRDASKRLTDIASRR